MFQRTRLRCHVLRAAAGGCPAPGLTVAQLVGAPSEVANLWAKTWVVTSDDRVTGKQKHVKKEWR